MIIWYLCVDVDRQTTHQLGSYVLSSFIRIKIRMELNLTLLTRKFLCIYVCIYLINNKILSWWCISFHLSLCDVSVLCHIDLLDLHLILTVYDTKILTCWSVMNSSNFRSTQTLPPNLSLTYNCMGFLIGQHYCVFLCGCVVLPPFRIPLHDDPLLCTWPCGHLHFKIPFSVKQDGVQYKNT